MVTNLSIEWIGLKIFSWYQSYYMWCYDNSILLFLICLRVTLIIILDTHIISSFDYVKLTQTSTTIFFPNNTKIFIDKISNFYLGIYLLRKQAVVCDVNEKIFLMTTLKKKKHTFQHKVLRRIALSLKPI